MQGGSTGEHPRGQTVLLGGADLYCISDFDNLLVVYSFLLTPQRPSLDSWLCSPCVLISSVKCNGVRGEISDIIGIPFTLQGGH